MADFAPSVALDAVWSQHSALVDVHGARPGAALTAALPFSSSSHHPPQEPSASSHRSPDAVFVTPFTVPSTSVSSSA